MAFVRSKLGRYEIIREIDRSNAIIYEAWDPFFNRRVAVKVLDLSQARTDAEKQDLIARFDREARAIGSLDHPNIMRVYDVGEDNGDHYLVMEFIEGTNLQKEIERRGLFDLQSAAKILIPALDALAYAHGKDIVHRDIKPANIFCLPNGHVKLIDFGIARKTLDPKLTQTGIMPGTPHYMSPEQWQGKDIDNRTDLFSLGVVAFLMLTGRFPFDGQDFGAICAAILTSDPSYPSNLDRGVVQFLKASIARSPDQRFRSANDMKRDLKSLIKNPTAALATGNAPRQQAPVAIPPPLWQPPGQQQLVNHPAPQPHRPHIILPPKARVWSFGRSPINFLRSWPTLSQIILGTITILLLGLVLPRLSVSLSLIGITLGLLIYWPSSGTRKLSAGMSVGALSVLLLSRIATFANAERYAASSGSDSNHSSSQTVATSARKSTTHKKTRVRGMSRHPLKTARSHQGAKNPFSRSAEAPRVAETPIADANSVEEASGAFGNTSIASAPPPNNSVPDPESVAEARQRILTGVRSRIQDQLSQMEVAYGDKDVNGLRPFFTTDFVLVDQNGTQDNLDSALAGLQRFFEGNPIAHVAAYEPSSFHLTIESIRVVSGGVEINMLETTSGHLTGNWMQPETAEIDTRSVAKWVAESGAWKCQSERVTDNQSFVNGVRKS